MSYSITAKTSIETDDLTTNLSGFYFFVFSFSTEFSGLSKMHVDVLQSTNPQVEFTLIHLSVPSFSYTQIAVKSASISRYNTMPSSSVRSNVYIKSIVPSTTTLLLGNCPELVQYSCRRLETGAEMTSTTVDQLIETLP